MKNWLALLAGWAVGGPAPTHAQVPPSSARITHVSTAPGVSIEVLDWGGTGRPLVLLPGGGASTARVFDDFAPLLTDQFRVIGITRRGNGTSSDVVPETVDDLVGDIVSVIDTMRLGPVVLAGHSFASSELSLFGEEFGSRCAGLIYLDSAYNYTDPALGELIRNTPPPQAPPMQPADSSSVEAVRRYTNRVATAPPESEIRAARTFGSDGRLTGTPVSSARRKIAGLHRTPHWESINCPSLAIYAIPAPLETWLPYYAALDDQGRARGQAYYEAFARWTKKHRDEFKRWPQNQVIEFPSASHYFFLEQPDLAARMIRTFASSLR